jgi:hypothetical protein
MTTIVYISNAKSYQKETSEILDDGKIKVYNFEYDANTECALGDGTIITPQDTITGAQIGNYTCVLANDTNEKISVFKKDLTEFNAVVGSVLMASLIAFIFTK